MNLSVISPYWAANMRLKSTLLFNAEIVLVNNTKYDKYMWCEVEDVNIEQYKEDCETGNFPSTASEFNSRDSFGRNISGETLLSKSRESINSLSEASRIKCITLLYSRYMYNRPFNSFYPLNGLDDENPIRRKKLITRWTSI